MIPSADYKINKNLVKVEKNCESELEVYKRRYIFAFEFQYKLYYCQEYDKLY